MDNAVQSTATLSAEQNEVEFIAGYELAEDDSQEAIESTEPATTEDMAPGALSFEELIMKEGRRQDGEVSVKLTDEQIKEKHDKFHEIYREQVLDTMEFGELRKQFNARKKLRETDMAKLDNCLVRGEETQCVTRWRIAAHKLKGFIPEFGSPDSAEEALIFDSDFNLIDRVPLTEMERQMQIEYEDAASTPVQDQGSSAEIHFGENGDIRVTMDESEFEQILAGDDDSEHHPIEVGGVSEVPETIFHQSV